MSVVASVLSRDWACVAFDGRARSGEKIVTEDIKKAKKVNAHVCIGFTGRLETAEKMLSSISSLCDPSALENLYCDEIADIVHREYSSWVLHDAQFLIVGFQKSGEVVGFLVKADKSKTFIDPSKEIKHVTLSRGEHGLNLGDFLRAVDLEENEFTVATAKLALESFICAVADVDPSVNKNVNFITFCGEKQNA